ncbi:MAG: PRC-barrel domain-containing protein [Deltaproteobacteria bacterium]|jgi:sporulation protein YlmC with PRC-barrel domain
MKKMMITASALLFSITLTTGAMAAGEYGSEAGQSSSQSEQVQATQQEQQVKSTNKLIGRAVMGHQGQEIGNISDIMIDTQTGQVAYALVSSGGVLGMGENQYIVPWNALHIDPQTNQLALDMSKDQLKDAPKGQTVATRKQAEKIFQFYGVAPYWEQGAQQQPQKQEPKTMEEQNKKKMGE